MPNSNTIKKPVSLVGTGRSGTTLLTNVFRRHHDFESYGETGNLIFPAYYHAEKSLPFCAPTITEENVQEYASEATRAMIMGVFPGEKERWFHKPIMLTSTRSNFDSKEEFHNWYWSSYNNIFPEAHTFTVLRNPASVIPSYVSRWGKSLDVATNNYCDTIELMIAECSKVDFAIVFEDLVNDSEITLKELFTRLNARYVDSCMDAFAKAHAPNRVDGKVDTISDIKARRFASDSAKMVQIDSRANELYEKALDVLETCRKNHNGDSLAVAS